MDYTPLIEKISQKITASGQTADRQRIEAKLRRLIEEFGVPPAEAERTVSNECAREYNIPVTTVSGTVEKKISDVLPGEWVTIEGKVVSLTPPGSPSIAQSGIIADGSGAIRFVAWAKSNLPQLSDGRWYRIGAAAVDEFRGIPSLKFNAGTSLKELEHDQVLMPPITRVADLRPGVHNLRAKVVQEFEPNHERMLQSGILGDESGTARFVIWRQEGRDKLVLNKSYSIYYTLVDEFNGRPSINLTTATVVPDDSEIVVPDGSGIFTGALASLSETSGLIKRCRQQGCNRVLSDTSICPVHGLQAEFTYDLRIRGWLDDGHRALDLLVPREATEALCGLTLDGAKEMAEKNLTPRATYHFLAEKLNGRYFSCRGREIEGRIIAQQCSFAPADRGEVVALLNRARGQSS